MITQLHNDKWSQHFSPVRLECLLFTLGQGQAVRCLVFGEQWIVLRVRSDLANGFTSTQALVDVPLFQSWHMVLEACFIKTVDVFVHDLTSEGSLA